MYRDAPVYRLLARNSQLFRFIDHRAEKLQVALYGRIPSAQRLELARLYPAAEATTRQILESEYQPMADAVRSFTFTCNERDEPARAAWLRVAKEVGIEPILGVAAAVEDAQDRGVSVRAADGAHWHDRGYEIVGKVLVEFFRTKLWGNHRG